MNTKDTSLTVDNVIVVTYRSDDAKADGHWGGDYAGRPLNDEPANEPHHILVFSGQSIGADVEAALEADGAVTGYEQAFLVTLQQPLDHERAIMEIAGGTEWDCGDSYHGWVFDTASEAEEARAAIEALGSRMRGGLASGTDDIDAYESNDI